MKKFICISTAIVYILSSIGIASAEPSVLQGADFIAEDTKQVCSATLLDSFADDSVIVVLNKRASHISKKFSKKDFDNLPISQVQELSVLDEDGDLSLTDTDSYRTILKLTLMEKSKENVLNMIKKLEKSEIVISAEPDYLVEPESLSDSPEDSNFGDANCKCKLDTRMNKNSSA